MKQLQTITYAAILLCAVLLTSCILKKGQVTIHDSEMEWPYIEKIHQESNILSDGHVMMWTFLGETQIGSLKKIIETDIYTCEPGEYSGTYDFSTKKWTSPFIGTLTLHLVDGENNKFYLGKAATITIHDYNKRTKRINATIEAEMVERSSFEMRKIKIEFQDFNIRSKKKH